MGAALTRRFDGWSSTRRILIARFAPTLDAEVAPVDAALAERRPDVVVAPGLQKQGCDSVGLTGRARRRRHERP